VEQQQQAGDDDEARRTHQVKLVASVKYARQELELNYPTTKGKVYSEGEGRYILCRLY